MIESDFGSQMILSSNLKGVCLADTEVAHGVLDFLVSKQKLCGPQVAGLTVYVRRLGTPERMRRVMRWMKARTRNPLLYEPPELLNADRTIFAPC